MFRSTPSALVLPAVALIGGISVGNGAPAVAASRSTAAATTRVPASIERAASLNRALTQALSGENQPACEITAVASEAKAVWAQRADGAWLAPKDSRPALDTLTLTLESKTGGSFVRLDFPTDGSLPAQGPGQASNGNAVIGEIEVEVAGKRVKAEAFSSVSQSNNGRVAAMAFDGVKQQGDPGWESDACGWETGGSKPAQIVIRLQTPVPKGALVTVRLIAKSRWPQHVPGCISGAIVGGEKVVSTAAQLKAAREEFDAWCSKVTSSTATVSPADILSSTPRPAAELAIAQAELLRAASVDRVWNVALKKDGARFLTAFLADQAWLDSFLLGGTEGTGRADFAQSLENLRLLYSQVDAKTWNDPVSKKLATAMALQGGTMNRYRFVERFHLIEKARGEGKLHGGFDQLDVRAMRHAINLWDTPFEFNGWLNETQFTAGGYIGACWGVPYTDPSTYGYSIQGWGFHDPLRHAYPSPRIFRSIGGVCGTLSGFGATSGLTHGVPAFTVGQPAHCAYVVRIGNNWATGNDVSGPHTNSWTAYENLGFPSTNGLLEITENAPMYPKAQRVLWAGRVQRAAGKPLADWRRFYASAVASQPINYAVWLEYIKAMEDSKDACSPKEWVDISRSAADTFKEHHEAAWALVIRCLDRAKSSYPKPAERAEMLLDMHRILTQTAGPKMYGYDVGRFLNWQVDWIGDAATSVDFYGKLLTIHYSEKPELNWVFGAVMNWGNDRFAKNPATAAGYAKAVGGFFETQGAKADKGQVVGTITAGIRKASEGGDIASYRTWQALAKKLLPPLTPGDVHLEPGHLAQRPKIESFPGTLLSADGMLQTSSVSYDRPLSYGQVLDGGEFGYFDTAHEAKPWAQVTLAGEGELSGIVLMNRYEFPSEKDWDIPLKVEVSSDGKSWTQVALIDKQQDVYRVDLQEKKLRAKFVRIERQPAADPAKNGRLHLRNFLVYGRRLY